jgi:hypothetical protein
MGANLKGIELDVVSSVNPRHPNQAGGDSGS